jgi:beta-glucosidase-like glycosyl hydrolase
MDLDRKIGQLFVVGAPHRDVIRHVRDNHVGGVIWFQTTTSEAARMNEELQGIAEIPLLISADLEAGMGMRFTDAMWWPPAMASAATGDPSFAEAQGRATAREALRIGVNHILAPVADVNVNPENPVINTRSYGEDPHEVARYVAAFVRGVQAEGCLATAKHFPGHGDTHVDSHRALPVLDVTRERLDRVELVPFRAAIAAGVASVMTGHLAVPVLDATRVPVRASFENVYGTVRDEVPHGGTMPATLSKPIIDLLRNELGFDGLVVTDAMDMGGLAAHFDPGEAAVRALEAGNDQVLFSPDTDAAIAAVRQAVRSGRLPEARIDESVARVLRAKRGVRPLSPGGGRGLGRGATLGTSVPAECDPRAAPLPVPLPPPGERGPAHPPFDDTALRAQELAQRSITLVRDTHYLLPLRSTRIAAVAVSPHGDSLETALHALHPTATPDDADVLVLLLALRPKSGAGRIFVPDDIQRLAAQHAKKTIAIAFGSPYVLHELGDVSTFVCAWGVQPLLQAAAIRAIRGEFPMTGKLPVQLRSR